MKLLLVEDYASVRYILTRALEDDFDVEAFSDGEVAWRRYAARPDFDAALLDCGLPGIAGPELLARIRRLSPLLPVVLMSAATQRAESLSQATAFVPKPIESLRSLGQLLLDAVRASRVGAA